MSICQEDYSLFQEEKDSFSPERENLSDVNRNYSSSILKAFAYQSNDVLNTYMYTGEQAIYSGNGYIYEFRGSLSEIKENLSVLHQLNWINEKTRAVIIQMTLYNSDVQLFTSVTFLVEILSSSATIPSVRFEPLDFYVFSSLLQLICTIIHMGFIFYFMYIEFQLFIKLERNYFFQFWSLIQVGIIGCSWGCVAVYIWRFKESNRISKLFSQTNGSVSINLQLAVHINNIFTYLLGFCCFFSLIRFVRLCRINRRLRLFLRTLQYASKELISFVMMFSVIFFSFICLFYLLFVSKMLSC